MKQKLFATFITAVSALALLFALIVLWTVLNTARGRAPQLMGYCVLRVISRSMEPTLPAGIVIFVKETPAVRLAQGDVIAFYSDDPAIRGEVNTHRIAAVEKSEGTLRFVTRGDAATQNDPYPVKDDRLIGKVVGSSRFLGGFAGAASNPLGFAAIIFLPLLLIIANSFREIVHLAKQEIGKGETK